MKEIEITSEEDLEILNDIEEKVIKNINLGYDSQVLYVLDNENAPSEQIELLKDKITKEIVVRLFKMSNALYFGKLLGGNLRSFFEVIMRLGMEPAKIYILAISIFSLSRDRRLQILAARNFATSILGRILSNEMGLHDRERKKVEAGGLFFEMGKIMMLLYQIRCDKADLNEEFILKYNPYLGLKIVEKFKLPEFLNELLYAPYLRFTEDCLHLSAIVNLAHSIVDKSFKTHGKFVIQSPIPDIKGLTASTPGSIILAQFIAVGLREYIEVITCNCNEKNKSNGGAFRGRKG